MENNNRSASMFLLDRAALSFNYLRMMRIVCAAFGGFRVIQTTPKNTSGVPLACT
jgi:hypothetical protein